ncbi:biotin--[acetyl-CoA-carboxylase] ligase [Desulfogranum mediterraneum]|uniref:biotin--[acetyl-CoA-carboxylase] ligase n=1 Tax=Desulfogranum mediterraneum TaxID=160661 RepID=UPI0003F5029A|nr:biotin--[acetyl-CoA-carboxylase] ligase [Desulfogranum mediterraneum]
MQIERLSATPSTNDRAKERIAAGERGPALIVATTQSAGKGQYERCFASPPGGLYFSLILQPALAPERRARITLAAGVAVAEYLGTAPAEDTSFQVQLKWPNDIYLQGKKVGGILCESVDPGDGPACVIIGIGLNVNTGCGEFPLELREIATSLAAESGVIFVLDRVLTGISALLIEKISLLEKTPALVLDQWRTYDYLHRRPVEYCAGSVCITGLGYGLADDGRYQLEEPGGRIHQILGGRLRPLSAPL